MKRLGILTGGGDAPGLNAAVRAAVKTAIIRHECEVYGIRNGFEGLLSKDGVRPLTLESVRGILPQGGTILGAANRGNPFARKYEREGESVIIDVSDQVITRINELALDCLIVVGGDGTLGIARDLHQKGVPVVGVPKTIDNDVGDTDLTFGFDTAVTTATGAIDRLHTTAEAHHRIMLLELMGRDAGFIALHAGIAGGADVILIPELPFYPEAIFKKLKARIDGGTHFSIVAVSEGARPHDGVQVYKRTGDELISPRLGGIGLVVGQLIEEALQVETRVTVLGHLQRGGSPTAFDRWLATRFGAAAVRQAAIGAHGKMVALRGGQVTAVDLEAALAVPKRVNLAGDTIQTARDLGIALGDEIARV